jgi:hypothetical protein
MGASLGILGFRPFQTFSALPYFTTLADSHSNDDLHHDATFGQTTIRPSSSIKIFPQWKVLISV